jgi:hypothetical protein
MSFSSLHQLQPCRSDVDITVALPLKSDTPKPHPHFSLLTSSLRGGPCCNGIWRGLSLERRCRYHGGTDTCKTMHQSDEMWRDNKHSYPHLNRKSEESCLEINLGCYFRQCVCSSGKQLNSHDARCSKIADGLTKAKHYRAAYPGMQNTDITIKIKTSITSLLEGMASEGTNALDSALARLEEDMKVYGLATPELATIQAESEQPVQWEWDDHRQDHYYWVAEGYFQYHKGGRVQRCQQSIWIDWLD